MLYACGWQEPDSIPSNVVIRKKKNDKYDNGAAGCGAGAACYCGAYPIDGAYYSDAPLFDGADGGAAGGDAGGCGGMAVTQIGPILLALCTFSPLGYLVPLGYQGPENI